MASDESLEELIADSLSKKKSREKSFADIYDLGYEKNDSSINDDREIFDAAKALAEDFDKDTDSLLDGLESRAQDELRGIGEHNVTQEHIQSVSNSELSSENLSQSDAKSAMLVSRAVSENTKEPSAPPASERKSNMITTNNRPKGHPVNRQQPQNASHVQHAPRQGHSQRSSAAASHTKKNRAVNQYTGHGETFDQFGRNTPSKEQTEIKNKKAKNGKKKKHRVRKVILIIILVLLILFGLASALIYRYIGMMNLVETGARAQVTSSPVSESYVKNILLIGSDTRDEENGRSDTMILISINSKTKQIVQTSFMRDSLVNIPGYGYAKLNAAYAYGGAELVMDTIEENFEIKIDKYMRIDFFSFVDIIDAVGGLELTVNDDEAAAMTDPMNEVNDIIGRASGTGNLTSGGTYTMDGVQALAYARIRYAGDGDFDRTGRQREVIEKLIEKFKSLGVFKLNSALETILPELTTNMSKTELYFLCLKAPFMLTYDMKQFRVPYGEQGEGYWSYGYLGDQSVLEIDFDRNNSLLKQVIFDGINADV